MHRLLWWLEWLFPDYDFPIQEIEVAKFVCLSQWKNPNSNSEGVD